MMDNIEDISIMPIKIFNEIIDKAASECPGIMDESNVVYPHRKLENIYYLYMEFCQFIMHYMTVSIKSDDRVYLLGAAFDGDKTMFMIRIKS